MKSFWNWVTVLIAICAVILPILYVCINYMFKVEGWGLANSITLCGIFITLLSALYSNYKSDLRTAEQIKENQNSLFIQLRFVEAKRGINDLILFLNETLGVYDQIVWLYHSNNSQKDKYLSPRAFLVMQFINIISDYELLYKLPITLRTEIETNLINFNDKEVFEKIRDCSKFKELLNEKGFKDDYHYYFNIIKSNNPPKLIQNYYLYTKFINEFNNAEDCEMHESVFRFYFGFKNIKTEDFYNHFNEIHNELINSSTEDLILKDIIK